MKEFAAKVKEKGTSKEFVPNDAKKSIRRSTDGDG
jgi:hypothetical protein